MTHHQHNYNNNNNSNRYNNLVQSDELDLRIPNLLINDDNAFQHGIPFNCKFIGSMDIPRPTSRVEIVAAMRRVRFEFKQKGIKKKKVTMTISINGIKTTLRKRRSKKKRLMKTIKHNSNKDYFDVDGGGGMLIESHPIYRIFYVSHDSQDVKIFSYIARETTTNLFHCCVFKANKKAQAMRIVRTVGQAFEVCHKLVGHPDDPDDLPSPNDENDFQQKVEENKFNNKNQIEKRSAAARAHKLFSKLSRRSSDTETKIINKHFETQEEPTPTPPTAANDNKINEVTTQQIKSRPTDLNLKQKNDEQEEEDLVNLSTPATPNQTQAQPPPPSSSSSPSSQKQKQFFGSSNEFLPSNNSGGGVGGVGVSGMSVSFHESQLLKEKLEQQQQQTQAALAQINLLRDQLAAESAARIEAQSRTHQLLLHNKELLDHLQSLVRHIQQLEQPSSEQQKQHGTNNISPAPPLPQLTPRSKIERWFQFAVLGESAEGQLSQERKLVEGSQSSDLFWPEDEENVFKIQKVRESKRTLISRGESGFVSENSNSQQQQNKKGFQFSSSSIIRRVLRLKKTQPISASNVQPISSSSLSLTRGMVVKRRAGNNKYLNIVQQKKNKSRRSRRAELEAVVAIATNKSGSNSTVNNSCNKKIIIHKNNKNRVSSI